MTTQTSNVNLFDIIAWVESKNNPHAMRFEPTVYEHVEGGTFISDPADKIIANIKTIHNCSQGTACMIYSTSWGATQVMGFNLYAGLYNGTVVDFMADTIAQIGVFNAFCANKRIVCLPSDLATTPMLRSHFATVYNGDAVAYSAQIVYALLHFGFQVTQ